MHKDRCIHASNSSRRAASIEDFHYGDQIERDNPVTKRKGFLDLAAKDWFGCVPDGFTVVPAVADGKTLHGIFYIVPAS